jgi:hypothetical protein
MGKSTHLADEIISLVGHDRVKHYFDTHVMPDKFRSKLPNGVYDLPFMSTGCREIVIDGCVLMVASKQWIDKGGPEEWDPALRAPWGTFFQNDDN